MTYSVNKWIDGLKEEVIQLSKREQEHRNKVLNADPEWCKLKITLQQKQAVLVYLETQIQLEEQIKESGKQAHK